MELDGPGKTDPINFDFSIGRKARITFVDFLGYNGYILGCIDTFILFIREI